MSGQQIGTVVGGIVGAYFGMPQLGMAIGGLIGGAIDPTKINGPHIGDGQTQTATDGSAISWIVGTAWAAGCIVQVGKRREVKVKDSGKGGPEVSHYEAHQDFAILICESSETRGSTISQVLMIEQDGKIVYDVRPGSKMLADSQKYKTNVDFLYGAEDQMPHPTLEAITGVGNTVAYRGSCIAVFKDFNLSSAGDRIPTFRFLVSSAELSPTAFPGGQSYPYTKDFSTPNELTKYTLVYTTGFVPDKFEVWAGSTMLVSTGYHGDPDRQSELNAALATYGDPPETIVAYPSGELDADQQWADPSKREAISFTKPEGITSITLKVWAPISGTSWNYALTNGIPGINLSDVIGLLCLRGGISVVDFDVSNIQADDSIVEGYTVARQSTASDCLLVLLQSYFSYGGEYDGQIHFNYYGDDALVTVSRDDLIEANDNNNNAITETTRNQATEFPRKITVSYYDPNQNYMAVDTSYGRSAADVIAIGETKIEMPVAVVGDLAAQAAQKAMKIAYAKLEGTRSYCLPFARSDTYISVCAGEAVLMDGKRWVLDEVDLSSGYLKFDTRYDRQSSYRSNLQVIKGQPPSDPTSRYSGPTTLIPMNLPSLRPQDTYGLYLAAASADGRPAWKGCNVLVSFDDQQTWQAALTIVEGSTLGKVVDNEPSDGEPLTVNVDGTGDLSSATAEQLAANANAFALVNGDTAEIGQFETAEQDSNGDYELTTIIRGSMGTTETPATAGQQFTMLDSVYFLPIDISFKGKTIALRAVGFNEVAEDQPVVTIIYNPDTTVIHDGGTVT